MYDFLWVIRSNYSLCRFQGIYRRNSHIFPNECPCSNHAALSAWCGFSPVDKVSAFDGQPDRISVAVSQYTKAPISILWLYLALRSYAILTSNKKLECGPMPNVMTAQPNIGDAVCESSVLPFLVPRRNIWLTPTAGMPCSNAAQRKTSK